MSAFPLTTMQYDTRLMLKAFTETNKGNTMNTYENLVGTMSTPALVHLVETRGTVSPERKDVIAAELDARGVSYNRPARPVS